MLWTRMIRHRYYSFAKMVSISIEGMFNERCGMLIHCHVRNNIGEKNCNIIHCPKTAKNTHFIPSYIIWMKASLDVSFWHLLAWTCWFEMSQTKTLNARSPVHLAHPKIAQQKPRRRETEQEKMYISRHGCLCYLDCQLGCNCSLIFLFLWQMK